MRHGRDVNERPGVSKAMRAVSNGVWIELVGSKQGLDKFHPKRFRCFDPLPGCRTQPLCLLLLYVPNRYCARMAEKSISTSLNCTKSLPWSPRTTSQSQNCNLNVSRPGLLSAHRGVCSFILLCVSAKEEPFSPSRFSCLWVLPRRPCEGVQNEVSALHRE